MAKATRTSKRRNTKATVGSRTKPHVPVARWATPEEAPSKIVYEVPPQGKGHAPVLIDSGDYERIIREGCPRNWFVNSNRKKGEGKEYVKVKSHRRAGNNVGVAWLILDIWKDASKEVHYRNGNPKDLRFGNLKAIARDENPHVQAARRKRAATPSRQPTA
jgi:hypothetical protein